MKRVNEGIMQTQRDHELGGRGNGAKTQRDNNKEQGNHANNVL